MNRTAAYVAIAVFLFTSGWVCHSLTESASKPVSQCAKSESDSVEGEPHPRETPAPLTHVTTDDSCRDEIDRLRSDLASTRLSLDKCQGSNASPNEQNAEDLEFEDFRDRIMESANEIGYAGEITFHCEEFPCIARFEGDVESTDLKQALQRTYGSDVDVMIEGHTSVGPDGTSKLRFAAVVPRELADNTVRDRFEERTWQLLIQKHLEHKRGTDEN